MDYRKSGLDTSFETMRDDKKRRAEEAILGEMNQKTRTALLELDSYLETLQKNADEEIQAKRQEIDKEFAELIKEDKPLDHLQLMLDKGHSTRRSETDSGVFTSRSQTQSPILRRELSVLSSEMKDTAASSKYTLSPGWCVGGSHFSQNEHEAPPAERAAPAKDPRMPPTQEHADKKTSEYIASSASYKPLTILEEISPETGRRSVAYDTDSTGDFEEEIPYRVPNPKAPEAVVTLEPGASDNDLELYSSSTKTVPGSSPPSSLPRPRRCAADRVNYNEKKYFNDLLGPQHKRKCSASDG
ncbi:hypothetical protein PG989_011205 [Apiospora arundinis]